MKHIVVYTDGSGTTGSKEGAWGAVINYPDGTKKELSQAYPNGTNNMMELAGPLFVLEYLYTTEDPNNIEVTIHTDSEYVVKGASEWIHKWILKGWKTTKGPVKNLEIWKALKAFLDKMNVHFVWVKGHNGNQFNEKCDKLANKARKEKIAEKLTIEKDRVD